MKETKTVKVKVWGEWACFTRPDLKVERMTYPCMTPSAARGILEAILYKPEFIWNIKSIYILNPIKFFSIRRNEISKKANNQPIIIEKERVMRNSIILRDVSYIIEAEIIVPDANQQNHGTKYMAMFNRRVEKGQCYKRPYFGTREFSLEFAPAPKEIIPIQEDTPIGGMLLDIFYDTTGKPQPRFFEASIRKGILNCEEPYKEMLKSFHLKPSEEINELQLNWNHVEEEEMVREDLL
jgi:CRISPR-associated protein Cas5d